MSCTLISVQVSSSTPHGSPMALAVAYYIPQKEKLSCRLLNRLPRLHPLLNARTGQRQGSGREHTLHSPFKPGDFIPEGLGTLTALAYFLLWVRRWRTCWRIALDFDFAVLSSVLQSSHRTLAHFQGEVGKSSQNDAPQ